MEIKRRKTRQVRVGDVRVGGGAGVSIQSMVKAESADVKAVVSQIKALESCGCEIVRVAVKTFDDADAIRLIKKRTNIPLVADIHFDYRLAIRSIAGGADKIRLNPGNIRSRGEIAQVIRAAKSSRIPIRIGVNSGSVMSRSQAADRRPQTDNRKPITENRKPTMAGHLVDAALGYVKLFEDLEFRDIIISLKSSDVASTVEAYRRIAAKCDYPLHLGVTASGPYDSGIVKSSMGIGALLLDGIGDTIRVSLTASPIEEVIAAKRILSALGIRRSGPEIISCPTCGRCQVNLMKIVSELEKRLYAIRYTLYANRFATIALMGCEVNGPGEASAADIGIAFGKSTGMLFKKGKIVKRVKAKDAVRELIRNL
ncbi:MAG: flavodoxin-dependent (E)-4-hydroxy-3-methylbut-2-enyl-diphosphate synthase [Candidatus Omnitrophota bacterium]|nr:flavodoxin-dependent (E)-4-hydroxy-3-methylbut-2-enyl-diphosphate synthase [Candidatus Omnitrophota bacterium]